MAANRLTSSTSAPTALETKLSAPVSRPPDEAAGVFDTEPAARLIERHRELERPFTCEFGGAKLEIGEGVFCPTLTNTSSLLLAAIEFARDGSILDVFSGSGAFGVIAALRGAARVVTVDISPAAVACAAKNAKANCVDHLVDVRLGRLEKCVPAGERFDMVIANPPLLPGDPADYLSAAIFDPGLDATRAFLGLLPDRLAEAGRAYLLTSDVFERCGYSVAELARKECLTTVEIARRDVGYEVYRVHLLRHQPEKP
jgi:methylase of polypeptide subunit release factors